ncbi:MAG: tRNA lysidine(34) synthetase TilS, partial [Desulfobacteraceae bacterium]
RLSSGMGLSLVVAHFDHGLRPGEDESETRFVAGLARERGLAFETEKARGLREGGSLEERAREARYAFLERVRDKYVAGLIALGHTLDDQAETVLMRLLRGSGPGGLGGIPPVREPGIIRPLIRLRRAEIEAYLRVRGLSWLIDPTNLRPCYLRNRIRLELIPELLEYQPRLVEQLGETADLIREEDYYLAGLAREWLDQWGVEVEGGVVLPRRRAAGLQRPLLRRVLRCAVERAAGDLRAVGRGHVEAAVEIILGERPQARVDLPSGWSIRRSYGQVIISRAGGGKRPLFHAWIPGPGEYAVDGAGLRVFVEERSRGEVGSLDISPDAGFLDADKVSFPLELRPWRAGERFMPLGMKGRKKVKDFFIDLKVPSEKRAGTPLLLSRGTPVWLCGFRIDERFKVTEKTSRVLEIRLE